MRRSFVLALAALVAASSSLVSRPARAASAGLSQIVAMATPRPRPGRSQPMMRLVDLGVTFEPRGQQTSLSNVEGELQIKMLHDGTLSGVFHQHGADGGTFPIHGTRTGNRLIFDVAGNASPFHVDGTLRPVTGGDELFGNAHIDRQDYAIFSDPCQSKKGGVSVLCR